MLFRQSANAAQSRVSSGFHFLPLLDKGLVAGVRQGLILENGEASKVQRQQQLTRWLEKVLQGAQFSLAPASADASFRRYFRVTLSDRTLVVMDAPPGYCD